MVADPTAPAAVLMGGVKWGWSSCVRCVTRKIGVFACDRRDIADCHINQCEIPNPFASPQTENQGFSSCSDSLMCITSRKWHGRKGTERLRAVVWLNGLFGQMVNV